MGQAIRDTAKEFNTSDREPRHLKPVDVAAEGRSGHGDVQVSVRNGRLTLCRITDSALTLDAENIGELVCDAANDALEQYQAKLVEALKAQQDTDMADIQKRLEAASHEAERGMKEYLDQLRELVDKARSRQPHTPPTA